MGSLLQVYANRRLNRVRNITPPPPPILLPLSVACVSWVGVGQSITGKVPPELNLIPSDNVHVDVTDLQETFQDAEPEILVVPNKRFVREILDGKKK